MYNTSYYFETVITLKLERVNAFILFNPISFKCKYSLNKLLKQYTG